MAEFVLKATTLSLIEVFRSKRCVLLLAQSSLLLMSLFLWVQSNQFLGNKDIKNISLISFYFIIFIRAHSEKKSKEFMKGLISFDSNIKFTYEYRNKRVLFLDFEDDTVESKLITSLFVKLD